MSEITLLQLPLDVLILVFSNLTVADVKNVMATCKYLWQIIRHNNYVWRTISRGKLVIKNSNDNTKTCQLSWYQKLRISNNWRKGMYYSKVVLYHKCNYMPWLKFFNSEAIFLSLGSELNCFPTDRKWVEYCKETLWKLQIPVVRRYDIRTNDITRFVIKNNLIVCGNRNGCISVYEMDNLRKTPQLHSHITDCHVNGLVEVTAVELLNSRYSPTIVTASAADAQLRYWTLSSATNTNSDTEIKFTSLFNLEYTGARCLAANSAEDKIAAGLNGNLRPIVMDVTTNKVVLEFEETKKERGSVRDVQWHNENTIMYITHSGLLQSVDIRSGNLVYVVLDPFQASLYCLKSDGGNAVVVGSSEYSRCVLFDLRNWGKHAQMYFTQGRSSPVYSLDFDSTKLISAVDRSVGVCNFNINGSAAERRDYSSQIFY